MTFEELKNYKKELIGELITGEQVCEILDVQESTLNRYRNQLKTVTTKVDGITKTQLVKDEKLPKLNYVKKGNKVFYKTIDVKDFMEQMFDN